MTTTITTVLGSKLVLTHQFTDLHAYQTKLKEKESKKLEKPKNGLGAFIVSKRDI